MADRTYKEKRKPRYIKHKILDYIKENEKARILVSLILPITIAVIITAVFAIPKIAESFYYKEKESIETAYNPEIMAFANANGIDYGEYPQGLISLLYRNREARDFVLDYPLLKDEDIEVNLKEYKDLETVPLFMQWDKRWGYIEYGSSVAGLTGCGPVSLSMCLYYLTEDENYSPDKMLEYSIEKGYCVKGSGTSWELFSKGAVELGFDVTEIGLDKDRIINNLKAKNPIVVIMGPGDFTTSGHFIVFTDTVDGLIKVNDPNSIKNSQKLWEFDDIKDQIRNLWVIRNKQE